MLSNQEEAFILAYLQMNYPNKRERRWSIHSHIFSLQQIIFDLLTVLSERKIRKKKRSLLALHLGLRVGKY